MPKNQLWLVSAIYEQVVMLNGFVVGGEKRFNLTQNYIETAFFKGGSGSR